MYRSGETSETECSCREAAVRDSKAPNEGCCCKPGPRFRYQICGPWPLCSSEERSDVDESGHIISLLYIRHARYHTEADSKWLEARLWNAPILCSSSSHSCPLFRLSLEGRRPSLAGYSSSISTDAVIQKPSTCPLPQFYLPRPRDDQGAHYTSSVVSAPRPQTAKVVRRLSVSDYQRAG